MEVTHLIECPFCGTGFETVIDTSISEQEFVSDCENCCRPLLLTIHAEPGTIQSIEVQSA